MTNMTTLGEMVTRKYVPNSIAAASNARAASINSQRLAGEQNKLLKKKKKKRLLNDVHETPTIDTDI